MVPGEVQTPGLETRLNLVSRRLLQLLAERGDAELDGLGAALQVSDPIAHVAAGWLARSRVADLVEDPSGKLRVSLRRPFE